MSLYSHYSVTKRFVNSISAAAAYKNFSFGGALIFRWRGANLTKRSKSKSVLTADGLCCGLWP